MRRIHHAAGLDQLGPTKAYENPGPTIVPAFWRPFGKRETVSRNMANESIRRRSDASTRVRKVKVTLAKVSKNEDEI